MGVGNYNVMNTSYFELLSLVTLYFNMTIMNIEILKMDIAWPFWLRRDQLQDEYTAAFYVEGGQMLFNSGVELGYGTPSCEPLPPPPMAFRIKIEELIKEVEIKHDVIITPGKYKLEVRKEPYSLQPLFYM